MLWLNFFFFLFAILSVFTGMFLKCTATKTQCEKSVSCLLMKPL